MKKAFTLTVVMAMVMVCSMQVHAALFNRGTDSLGNRLIYDSDLNITWYDYSNNFDLWQNQMDWVSRLDVNFGGTHYTDWRLPKTLPGSIAWSWDGTTTVGYNITNSELGHLFYTTLGYNGYFDTSGNPQAGPVLKNTGYFQHLLVGLVGLGWVSNDYWSSTEIPLGTGIAHYIFNMGYGHQNVLPVPGLAYERFAIAVRDGDVAILPDNPTNNGHMFETCRNMSENVLPENSFISHVTTDGLSAGTINYTANGKAGTLVMNGSVFPMIVQINKAAGNLITLKGKTVKELVALSSDCTGYNPSLQGYERGVKWTVSAATANTGGGGGNGGGGTAQLQFEGFIQAINNPNITIAKEGTSITLAVIAQTKITLNGQIAALGSLQAGDKAQGKYDGGTKKIIQLTVER